MLAVIHLPLTMMLCQYKVLAVSTRNFINISSEVPVKCMPKYSSFIAQGPSKAKRNIVRHVFKVCTSSVGVRRLTHLQAFVHAESLAMVPVHIWTEGLLLLRRNFVAGDGQKAGATACAAATAPRKRVFYGHTCKFSFCLLCLPRLRYAGRSISRKASAVPPETRAGLRSICTG